MKKVVSALLCVMFASAVVFAASSTGNKSSGTAAKPAAAAPSVKKTPAASPAPAAASSSVKKTTVATPAATKTTAKQSVAEPVKNGGQMAVGYSVVDYSGGNGWTVDNLAFRYRINDLLAVEGLLGFNAGDAGNAFVFGGKVFYTIKEYSTFNVYGTGGMNLGVIDPDGGESTTIFGIMAGAGVEYFIARNLSISSELGLAGNFMKDNNMFGTIGNWVSNLGIRYYLD
ncbi:MAG: outer membrane beta-barrel protein [Endomicrobia bacterium]|nr:outer membrane beta-barrel protein [Endomicrobiia bacterium]